MVLYKAIYELIKDVHGKSAAGRTVYEVFFKLRTPIKDTWDVRGHHISS